MVRSVLAEVEHVEGQIQKLLATSPSAQTGLLIGKVGVASRDHVYALLPTPPSDNTSDGADTSNASRKGSKGEVPLQVDPEWIGEHTRQVSRMLPGGLSVLGIYAICSEAALKAAGAVLWEALTVTAGSAGPRSAPEGTGAELLLLHVSRQPRKFSCRSSPVGIASASGFQSLRPCELKFGQNLSTLHCLQASYRIGIRLPIRSDSTASFRASIESAIAAETTKLLASECTVDGALAEPTQTVAALQSSTPEVQSGSEAADSVLTHGVQFLARPSWASADGLKMGEEPREKSGAVLGHVALNGAVHVRAYSHPKQTLGEALADLKTDLARSLRARLELMVEEAERAEEEREQVAASAARESPSDGGIFRPQHALLDAGTAGKVQRFGEGMPRRVLVPWLGGVRLSEYLIGTESVTEAAERCRDMLGVSFVAESGLVEVEKPAVPGQAAQNSSDSIGSEVEGLSRSSNKQQKGGSACNQATLAATIGALATALLAVSLAYFSR